MHDFAYGDRRMHMGIPVCKRAGIAENFAYGDPITHNEIVRIRGLTCTLQKLTKELLMDRRTDGRRTIFKSFLCWTSREGLRHVAIMRSDEDGTILAHNNTRFRLVSYIEKGGERSAGSG